MRAWADDKVAMREQIALPSNLRAPGTAQPSPEFNNVSLAQLTTPKCVENSQCAVTIPLYHRVESPKNVERHDKIAEQRLPQHHRLKQITKIPSRKWKSHKFVPCSEPSIGHPNHRISVLQCSLTFKCAQEIVPDDHPAASCLTF